MDPTRWLRITKTLDAVAVCPPERRQAMFEQECAVDADLVSDLERFLGLDDRLEIRGVLGKGGFGYVFKVYNRPVKTEIALKTLHRVEPDDLARFKNEFRIMEGVHHEHLVQLYQLVSTGNRCFFTMELIEGPTFCNYARLSDPWARKTTVQPPRSGRKASSSSGLPADASEVRRLRDALKQLAQGVCALHQNGLLHRDIKPSNIRVNRQGKVVLLDFGLVKELTLDPADETGTTTVKGTPEYMAPEQALGKSISEASDWYSVGVVLFEALTGNLPYARHAGPAREPPPPPPPRTMNPSVPADLNELCQQLLAVNPKERPTGQEVLRCLGGNWTVKPDDDAPFVGREKELAELHRCFEHTREGRAIAVFVHGESGMGMSTLLEAFIAQLHQRQPDAVILESRCYERESSKYKGLDPLIVTLSHYLKLLPATEAEAVVPANAAALARLFPVLNRVDAIAKCFGGQVALDPIERQWQARDALRELLRRLAKRFPILLFIDDLQWGDRDSANLLGHLFDPPEPPQIALMTCYPSGNGLSIPHLRNLLGSEGSTGGEIHELEVGRLSVLESQKLVRQLLGESYGEALALAHRSGGNPRFLVHFARLSLRGTLPQADQLTLLDLIWSQLEELNAGARRLIVVVAVANHPVPVEVAIAAAKLDADPQGAVMELQTHNLIRIRNDHQQQLEIENHWVRETAVQGLAPTEIQLLHQRLAKVLEATGLADAETLATHFREAGDLERAAELALAAARQANETLAFEQAVQCYEFLVTLDPANSSERHELQVALAHALAKAGRSPRAAEAYLEAAASAGGGTESLDLRRRAAVQQALSGDARAYETIRQLLQSIGTELPRTRPGLLLSLSSRRLYLILRTLSFQERETSQIPAEQLFRIDAMWSGAGAAIDPLRWLELATRHLIQALEAGDAGRIVRALLHEVFVASAMGGRRSSPRADRITQRAMRLAKKLDDPYSIGLANEAMGLRAYFEGRWKKAGEMFERSEARLRESLVDWELTWVIVWQMQILFLRGHLGELCDRLPRMLKDVAGRGGLFAEVLLRSRAAWIARLAADQVVKASEELQKASERLPTNLDYFLAHYFQLSGRVEIALYRQDGNAAWAALQDGWPELKHSGLLRIQLDRVQALDLRCRGALAAAVELGNGSSEAEKIRRLLLKDLRHIEAQKLAWSNPLAQLLRAGLATFEGETDRALQCLIDADVGFEAVDMELHAAVCRRRRGQLLDATGGCKHVEGADAWMLAHGIHNPERMADVLAPGRWQARLGSTT